VAVISRKPEFDLRPTVNWKLFNQFDCLVCVYLL